MSTPAVYRKSSGKSPTNELALWMEVWDTQAVVFLFSSCSCTKVCVPFPRQRVHLRPGGDQRTLEKPGPKGAVKPSFRNHSFYNLLHVRNSSLFSPWSPLRKWKHRDRMTPGICNFWREESSKTGQDTASPQYLGWLCTQRLSHRSGRRPPVNST